MHAHVQCHDIAAIAYILMLVLIPYKQAGTKAASRSLSLFVSVRFAACFYEMFQLLPVPEKCILMGEGSQKRV